MEHKYTFFKKADIVLAAGLIALGFVVLWFTHSAQAGSLAVVVKDGKTIGSYSLAIDKTVEIDNGTDRNVLVIENGSAYMQEANCSGQDCIGFGRINKPGQVILCLPHKLSVTITGEGGSDAVSY